MMPVSIYSNIVRLRRSAGVPLLRLAATWAPGEPDNCDNSENCLEMIIIGYHNGLMADKPCDKTLPYVCYKKGANLTITECGTADPGNYYFLIVIDLLRAS